MNITKNDWEIFGDFPDTPVPDLPDGSSTGAGKECARKKVVVNIRYSETTETIWFYAHLYRDKGEMKISVFMNSSRRSEIFNKYIVLLPASAPLKEGLSAADSYLEEISKQFEDGVCTFKDVVKQYESEVFAEDDLESLRYDMWYRIGWD